MQHGESRAVKRIRHTLALFVPGLVETYDYDSHMMRRAFAYGCGIFTMAMAFCVQALCQLLPATEGSDAETIAEWLDHIIGLLTKEFVDGHFASSHIIATVALFVLLGIGIAICLATRSDHDAFIEAFPHVDDPYDAERIKQGVRIDRTVAVIGAFVAIVGAGILVWRFACMGEEPASDLPALVDALGFFLFAIGLFAYSTGLLAARRFNVFAYNYAALRKKSPYEIYQEEDGPERDLALQEKALQELDRWVSRTISGIAVIVTFVLFALPSIRTPFYWVTLVIAAIVMHLYSNHNLKRAHALYEKSEALLKGIDGLGPDFMEDGRPQDDQSERESL